MKSQQQYPDGVFQRDEDEEQAEGLVLCGMLVLHPRHGKKPTKKLLKRIQAYLTSLGEEATAGEDFDCCVFSLEPPTNQDRTMVTDLLNDPDRLFEVYGHGLRIRVAMNDRPDSTDAEQKQKAMAYALKHARRHGHHYGTKQG